MRNLKRTFLLNFFIFINGVIFVVPCKAQSLHAEQNTEYDYEVTTKTPQYPSKSVHTELSKFKQKDGQFTFEELGIDKEAYIVKDPKILAITKKILSKPDDLVKIVTPNPHSKAQWFPEAGLGLFMHWGIHSVAGAQPSWSMIKDYRWAKPVKLYPPQNYFALAESFKPDKWNPEKWLKLAKDAHFKYAVLTIKHHDGFALWPSKYGNFNTKNYLNGRDLVKDYVEGCRENELKVGLYFSPRDWHHPYYPMTDVDYDNNKRRQFKEVDPVEDREHFEQFMAYTIGQLYEILTSYGKIDVLWFDGFKWHDHDLHSKAVFEWIRSLQPGIIINDRWAKVRNPDNEEEEISFGDITTHEVKEAAHRPVGWWEQCTIWDKGGWGYNVYEEVNDTEWLLRGLIRARAWGGNFLPNIGPRPDGEMTRGYYSELPILAKWMDIYASSIFGTTALQNTSIVNVPVTCRDNAWYLHINPEYDRTKPITVDTKAIPSDIIEMRNSLPLNYSISKGIITIDVPQTTEREVIRIAFNK